MTSSSLDTLGLSAATIRRIRGLGVDSADALRGLADAAPLDLERHVGEQAMSAIRRALGDWRPSTLSSFDPDEVQLRARLGRAPGVRPVSSSLQRRDQLFERLQRLRATGSSEDEAEVTALEIRLNALLDSDR